MRMHFGERGRYVPDFVMVDSQRLRARVEAAVETLLLLLDEMDTDPDLEPDLGLYAPDFPLDAEEDDPLEDDGDCEWSLSATNDIHQNFAWCAVPSHDLEEDCDSWEIDRAALDRRAMTSGLTGG